LPQANFALLVKIIQLHRSPTCQRRWLLWRPLMLTTRVG
jgi:hypothetical protein